MWLGLRGSSHIGKKKKRKTLKRRVIQIEEKTHRRSVLIKKEMSLSRIVLIKNS